jgi:hypothetical protein
MAKLTGKATEVTYTISDLSETELMLIRNALADRKNSWQRIGVSADNTESRLSALEHADKYGQLLNQINKELSELKSGHGFSS